MKRGVLFLFTVFVFINPLRAQIPSPDITFDERIYDFGTILEKNGKVSHTFVFHNRGKNPVTINQVYSDCGCIGKMLSKSPIKSGEKGRLTITFNPAYQSGFFSKEIAVFSNDGKNYNRIWVQGIVKPSEHPVQEEYPYNFGNGLYLRLQVMAFGYMKPGETKQMELHYANNTNKPMILTFVPEEKNNGLKYTNPDKIDPKKRGSIMVSYAMSLLNHEDVILHLRPFVNGKKSVETVEIKILNALTKK
jgi:hypothetical protein